MIFKLLLFLAFFIATEGIKISEYREYLAEFKEVGIIHEKRIIASDRSRTKTKMNFFQAERFCTLAGGDLLAVENKKESDFIKKYLKQNGYDKNINNPWASESHIWIGGTRNGEPHDVGNFYWIKNGLPLDFTNWMSGEPNNRQFARQDEHCVALGSNFDFGWNDVPCTFQTYDVLCEIYWPNFDPSVAERMTSENEVSSSATVGRVTTICVILSSVIRYFV